MLRETILSYTSGMWVKNTTFRWFLTEMVMDSHAGGGADNTVLPCRQL